MKKEFAMLLMLVFVVLAVSLVLVKFVKVVHAACCQAPGYCYPPLPGGACMEDDTYFSSSNCCSDGVCRTGCSTTTTSTTTTVSTTTTIPEHGQVCDHTITPSCDPNKPLDCMSGGCNGEWVCCYKATNENPGEHAYCNDPPGGVAVSYCAKSKGTDPKCTYCKDLNGDHYNVGDCVTTDPSVCSSGWMICTDTCDTSQNPPVYEWGCEDHPEQNCPNYGGSGSTTTTSSTSTTTIPYDVLSVSYASLHNGANPVFPALQVNCSVSQQGDQYHAYYWAVPQAVGVGNSGGSGVAEKACQNWLGWDGNNARFGCPLRGSQ